jgi:hydroxymethylpyrimidine pyrophosphatase-like HAD family hydrolase
MLMHCGTGVAMKNAIPEAIMAANTVTETNNDDGVAKYIVSNIL